MSAGARIILTEEDDWWVATDEETGITSQGPREAALENLDEALDGLHVAGMEPTDDRFRKVGTDPELNVAGDLDVSEIFE